MRVAVIGMGSIGKRHAKNLEKLGHEIVAYDPNMVGTISAPDLAIAAADAVVIASPPPYHADHILEASRAKVPCFVEKPIADRMHPVLNYATMVGTNLRFHECVQQAQDWINEGLLGRPLWANLVCAQYNDKPAYLRDGVILNWGAHEIDLALYLLGPAKVAASSTRLTDGKDDLTDIILEHDSGCRSTIHLDYLTKPEVRQTIIVGEKATIIMDLVGRQAWLRDASGGVIDAFVAQDSWDQNYVDEMRAFIDRIDGKDTLGATGEDGLRALEICLKVREQAGLA